MGSVLRDGPVFDAAVEGVMRLFCLSAICAGGGSIKIRSVREAVDQHGFPRPPISAPASASEDIRLVPYNFFAQLPAVVSECSSCLFHIRRLDAMSDVGANHYTNYSGFRQLRFDRTHDCKHPGRVIGFSDRWIIAHPLVSVWRAEETQLYAVIRQRRDHFETVAAE